MAKTFGPTTRVLLCTAVLAACAMSINQAQSAIDRGLRALDPPARTA